MPLLSIRRHARGSLAIAAALGATAVALTSGCVAPPPPAKNYDDLAQSLIRTSFVAQGQAKLERLDQDPLQKICSGEKDPVPEVVKQLEAEQLLTVKWPAGAKYLGDWREGEKLAQNGRGMTWTDAAEAPAGGNCYNCHQIGKNEISYGTLGPSLYNYGKLRGIDDPYSRRSSAIVTYTWGKIYNAKAYNACSTMPRFGHERVLTEKQIQDLMALLLDPKSPVNQ